jgi:phosphopantothenoylcysteine synthetase/decarboxylase
MRVLLTSGGTKVPLDEVRHIGNMSNGTFGDHICRAFLELGWEVTFLYAKGSRCQHEFIANLAEGEPIDHMRRMIDQIDFLKRIWGHYCPVQYSDFDDYAHKLRDLAQIGFNVVVLAAAASDFAPKRAGKGKTSSDKKELTIELEQTPKLIREIKSIDPGVFLVGFKMLCGSTHDELVRAMKDQREKTAADIVVGNDIREIRQGKHALSLMGRDEDIMSVHDLPGATMAFMLVNRIIRESEASRKPSPKLEDRM